MIVIVIWKHFPGKQISPRNSGSVWSVYSSIQESLILTYGFVICWAACCPIWQIQTRLYEQHPKVKLLKSHYSSCQIFWHRLQRTPSSYCRVINQRIPASSRQVMFKFSRGLLERHQLEEPYWPRAHWIVNTSTPTGYNMQISLNAGSWI